MSRSCGIPDLIHIKNESHLGMDWTRGDRSRGVGAHLGPAPCCLDGNPPQEYPGMSRNKLVLFIRTRISRLEASQHLITQKEPGPRSTLGEVDLGKPVVQTAALLAEQVQLVQNRVLPGIISWVLVEQKDRGTVSHKSLSQSITDLKGWVRI